eukprot:jgi/Tetstr1/451902/TSEL_038938.t1
MSNHARLTTTLALALGLCAIPAIAQDNALGRDEYMGSCAACHGTDGRGHGEFAAHLNVEPADLTKLTENNDGVFPYLYVFQTVDGRAVVRGHGSPMPIWGAHYSTDIGDTAGPYGAELLIRARITALVDYVESLQD